MPVEMLQNGRYRLLRPLGSGAMGEVYLMEDTRINRNVAIKVIRSETGLNPQSDTARDAARLFQREARAIAALEHPNILPLYDFGEESFNGTTLTYMVMPFCPEGSLADWIRQRGGSATLSPQDIASLISQAAEGLQYAHDHNVIHLDVKPPNFLLRGNSRHPNRPNLLLADFGVAKLNATTSGSSQTVRGTPAAMAPEQWSSTPVPATDQYALAIMAYELLAGRPPFLGGLEQMMFQHFNTEPPAPSTFNPLLSSSIDAVLLHALAKRPEARFPSISAFATALEQAVQFSPTAPESQQPSTNDIQATLAISSEEAQTGTSRNIALPGGRRMTVPVPAGAYNGQIIRLQNVVAPFGTAGPAGTLILTLAVQQTENVFSGPDVNSAEKTVRASNPNIQQPSHPHLPSTEPVSTPQTPAPPNYNSNSSPNLSRTVFAGPTGGQGGTAPAASNGGQPGFAPPPPVLGNVGTVPSGQAKIASRSSASRWRIALLIGVVLLVIVGGTGLYFIINANQAATLSANATATANASNATGTANVQATGTAASAALDATGTADANINATKTAIPGTATATAYQNTYSNATSGTPALNDALSDNTGGNGWSEGTSSDGGGCTFTGGDYHVSTHTTNNIHFCSAFPNFINFAFEVQMKIDTGDSGGVLFRSSGSSQYMFSVGQNGSYSLFLCDSNTCHTGSPLTHGTSDAISQGSGQTNIITVIAQGNVITLYVNQKGIASLSDSTYHQGQVGVIAEDNTNATEVEYSNAKVWKL